MNLHGTDEYRSSSKRYKVDSGVSVLYHSGLVNMRKRKRCLGSCEGIPQPSTVDQLFTRKGSAVEVMIKGIPADVCPMCGQALLTPEVSREIHRILEPFHGRGQNVPSMPPAHVIVEYDEAMKKAETG